jgi:hypothetical protein
MFIVVDLGIIRNSFYILGIRQLCCIMCGVIGLVQGSFQLLVCESADLAQDDLS